MSVVLFALGILTLAGVGVTAWLLTQKQESTSGPLMETVREESFVHDVVESGEIESSDNVELRCNVKGRNSAGTAILEVKVAEGDIVEEGQVLVLLDSSAFEQEERQEEIITNNKEAAMIQAENLWEAAKLAKQEYLEGTFLQDEQTFQSAVFVAEEDLRRAQEYARFSERLAAKGYVTALQLESDRFAVEKARKDLESAQTKLHVLRTYTKQKTLRKLESDIKSAEAAFNADKSSFLLQKQQLEEIRQQINSCILKVPEDDNPEIVSSYEVVFANRRDHRGNNEFVVEPGAMVRERQAIIRLPSSNKMRVKAKISEAKIALVRENMKATVTIDAFGGLTLEGTVSHVNKYPEPGSWFKSSVKRYTTLIEIDDPPENLKPGLTAKVRIHTEFMDRAVQVPIQTVHYHRGRYYCLVPKTAEPGWNIQEVELGSSNEKSVVIQSGLESGQAIAANPAKYADSLQFPDIEAPEEAELAKQQRAAAEQPVARAGGDASKATPQASPTDGQPRRPPPGVVGGGRPGGKGKSGKSKFRSGGASQ